MQQTGLTVTLRAFGLGSFTFDALTVVSEERIVSPQQLLPSMVEKENGSSFAAGRGVIVVAIRAKT